MKEIYLRCPYCGTQIGAPVGPQYIRLKVCPVCTLAKLVEMDVKELDFSSK